MSPIRRVAARCPPKQVVTQVVGWLEENGDTEQLELGRCCNPGSLLMDRSVLLAAIVLFGKEQI